MFTDVEAYAPGFRSSIVGYEVLTPDVLEATFGLTGGNIFHGAMGLDQLYFGRPLPGWANSKTPIKGLFLCGSGAHPGLRSSCRLSTPNRLPINFRWRSDGISGATRGPSRSSLNFDQLAKITPLSLSHPRSVKITKNFCKLQTLDHIECRAGKAELVAIGWSNAAS